MMKRIFTAAALLTALLATPAHSQFVDQRTWGGTSTGSAGAYAIVIPNIQSLAQLAGAKVRFIPNFANAGASNLAIAPCSGCTALTATAIQRVTPDGLAALGGGEIVTQTVEVIFNGTTFEIQNPAITKAPGELFDVAYNAGCPTGSLETTGATVAQATYPQLYAKITTQWGSPGGSNFIIPDLRGRGRFSRDSGGSARITIAGGNQDGTAVGTVFGNQNQTLAANQVPQLTFQGAPVNVAIPNSGPWTQLVNFSTNFGGSAIAFGSTGATLYANNMSGAAAPTVTATGTVNNTGSQGQSHTIMPPGGIVVTCVRL